MVWIIVSNIYTNTYLKLQLKVTVLPAWNEDYENTLINEGLFKSIAIHSNPIRCFQFITVPVLDSFTFAILLAPRESVS